MGDVIKFPGKEPEDHCPECGGPMIAFTEEDMIALGQFFAGLRVKNWEALTVGPRYEFGISFYFAEDGTVWMNGPYIGLKDDGGA